MEPGCNYFQSSEKTWWHTYRHYEPRTLECISNIEREFIFHGYYSLSSCLRMGLLAREMLVSLSMQSHWCSCVFCEYLAGKSMAIVWVMCYVLLTFFSLTYNDAMMNLQSRPDFCLAFTLASKVKRKWKGKFTLFPLPLYTYIFLFFAPVSGVFERLSFGSEPRDPLFGSAEGTVCLRNGV